MTLSRRACLAVVASAAAAPRLLRSQETRPSTAPATVPPAPPADAAGARTACDGLIATAVRTSFGWGWADAAAGAAEPAAGSDPATPRPAKARPQPVDAVPTASAGLLLLRAGQVLREPAYLAAAFQAGRGALALQTRKGQIRHRGVPGAFGGALDDPADVPDRRPTRLGLALALLILDAAQDPSADDVARDRAARLRPPATLAAHWLANQQTRTGAWPVVHPPGAEAGKGVRLLKLTDPDFRDTALAVRLAADVLDDRLLDGRLVRVADCVRDVRIFAGRPQRRALWAGAYKLDGDPNPRQPDLPGSLVDLLGTRHAVEVLLSGVLAGGKPTDPAAVALTEARDAIAGLPRTPAGDWYRRYDLALKPIRPMQAATQPDSPFALPVPDNGDANALPSDPPQRTADLLRTLDRLAKDGPTSLALALTDAAPIRRRLALMIGQVAPDALISDDSPDGNPRLHVGVRDGWRSLGAAALLG